MPYFRKIIRDFVFRGQLPGQLIIQYSDACNAKCPQCELRSSAGFPRSRLDMDHVKRMIDAAAGMGFKSLSIDGPCLSKMKKEMKGQCTFTGYLEGEKLAAAYASCDLFVFPSTTDTFGNVVLEAQASGLPVVVTDRGGPHENIIEDITGTVVKGDSESALLAGMDAMLARPDRLRAMGKNAFHYARDRSYEQAFESYWNMYSTGAADSAEKRPGEVHKSVDVA